MGVAEAELAGDGWPSGACREAEALAADTCIDGCSLDICLLSGCCVMSFSSSSWVGRFSSSGCCLASPSLVLVWFVDLVSFDLWAKQKKKQKAYFSPDFWYRTVYYDKLPVIIPTAIWDNCRNYNTV